MHPNISNIRYQRSDLRPCWLATTCPNAYFVRKIHLAGYNLRIFSLSLLSTLLHSWNRSNSSRTTCQVCPLLVNNVKKMTKLVIGHTVLLQSITQHYKTFVWHPLGIRHNMRHGIVDMCRIDVAKIVDMYN